MRHIRFFPAIFIVLCMCSCGGTPTQVMTDVNPLSWSGADPAVVVIGNSDTLEHKNITFLLRYNDELETDRLEFTVKVTAPDGTYFSEDMTVFVDRAPRKQSDMHDVELPYREAVVLSDSGDYVFSVRPVRELRGINAVGFNITGKR